MDCAMWVAAVLEAVFRATDAYSGKQDNANGARPDQVDGSV